MHWEPNKNIIKGHFLTNVFLKALPAAITDAVAVGALVIFGKTFGVGETDISTAATMLLAIVGFMILYKISAPMNMLRTAILTGCIAGLLFCSIFLNDLFAITGMNDKMYHAIYRICHCNGTGIKISYDSDRKDPLFLFGTT